MKNTLLILSVLLLSLAACKKADTQSPNANHSYSAFVGRPQPYTGTVTSLKNGEPWKASVYAYGGGDDPKYQNRFAILMDNYATLPNGDTFRRDEVTFGLIFAKTYTFSPVSQYLEGYISNKAADTTENAYFMVWDLDAVSDRPYILESEANFLQVTNFNTSTRTFAGKFEMTFLSSGASKDTIRFTNGVFNGKVYDSFFP